MSGSFSGLVSDSLSCALAVSLMGSLAVLLPLLPLSLVCLHLAESFTMFLVGALVVYQLFSDHVSGWVSGYVHLFLCPCSVPVSPNCIELFLWGAVWLFWAVPLASVFAVCLAVPLWFWLSVWQCSSLDLYFCLVDIPPPTPPTLGWENQIWSLLCRK